MATINIRRDVKDSFYRYQMPKLQSKIEGKGNGIKTVIPNMTDVAKALGRPPLYLTKFFGFELGAQTTIVADMDRYIVNGAHDAAKLQDLLDVFIRRFVLCASCLNPETELSINKKDQTITYDCKACGYRGEIDGRHKLTGVIVKNPPAKKSHKHKKASGHGEEDDAAEDELTRRIRKEAAELPTAETINEEDWAVDTSEEAVRARVQELEGNIENVLSLNDSRGEDDEADARYDEFGQWLELRLPMSDVDIYKKMKEENIHHKSKAIAVLVQRIIRPPFVGQFEKHAALFKKLCNSDKHERAILGGYERLIESTKLQHLDSVSKVLLEIYESDLVSEGTLEKWGAKPSKKYVSRETSKKIQESARPFLNWLAEASDESESEDE
ncbi:translation initiation factor eIF5 [Schizosaccharomyces octosporus yFS286]|uniref:Translation initiation factor eIF5 n=1 Tax=Schizosaccharomyces octosporus (strain yFS286) TaxID=483514 RepID=S9R8E9_SCHOY|nr:translation initiation factor eIF5 [Schizosaccharomyces octosporus yFS286]EPX74485.1 translation initiation factor eIF5 [Schizosaccharomyces octosporus yFS286]